MNSSSLSRRELMALMGVAALTLAGCGRKASPVPPLDADLKAPREYPVDRRRPKEEPGEETEEQQSPFLTRPDPFNRTLPPSPVYR